MALGHDLSGLRERREGDRGEQQSGENEAGKLRAVRVIGFAPQVEALIASMSQPNRRLTLAM